MLTNRPITKGRWNYAEPQIEAPMSILWRERQGVGGDVQGFDPLLNNPMQLMQNGF